MFWIVEVVLDGHTVYIGEIPRWVESEAEAYRYRSLREAFDSLPGSLLPEKSRRVDMCSEVRFRKVPF